MVRSRQLVSEYDAKIAETGDVALAAEANEKLCAMAKEETTKALTNVAKAARSLMKNGFKLADH